jgi:hypothetical protein
MVWKLAVKKSRSQSQNWCKNRSVPISDGVEINSENITVPISELVQKQVGPKLRISVKQVGPNSDGVEINSENITVPISELV